MIVARADRRAVRRLQLQVLQGQDILLLTAAAPRAGRRAHIVGGSPRRAAARVGPDDPPSADYFDRTSSCTSRSVHRLTDRHVALVVDVPHAQIGGRANHRMSSIRRTSARIEVERASGERDSSFGLPCYSVTR